MTKAIREQLENVQNASHAGLLLTRYLKAHKPSNPEERNRLKETPEEELLSQAMRVQASEVYKAAYERWQQQILETHRFTKKLASSLAIGLGNESPLEIGLTVSHTYGMPVIPGSAIKGMCRRGASKLLAEGKIKEEEFNFIFGSASSQEKEDSGSAGYVTFYDAWYDPSSVEGKPFHRDIITVHHQDYYGKRGGSAPTDFDDPIPVPFLVVKKGASFLFSIEAPTPEWSDFTINLIKWSLVNIGIGGKTNAGYGYYESDQPAAGQQGYDARGEAASPPVQQPAPATESWENVTVILNPGNGELSVQYQGRRALSVGTVARELRASMSPEAQEKLRAQRRIQADVKVEVDGNKIKITEIKPK